MGDTFDSTLRAAQRGDERALMLLYENHVAMVYGYFRSCGVIDPEDLTSEVFVGVLRGLARFRGDHPDFRRWMMTIAHRRLVDHRRRSRPERELPLDRYGLDRAVGNPWHGGGGTVDLTAGWLDGRMVRAFGLLTPAQREVLGLRFVADLSLKEVAAITGRTVGAVTGIQRRALVTLRLQLRDQGGSTRQKA